MIEANNSTPAINVALGDNEMLESLLADLDAVGEDSIEIEEGDDVAVVAVESAAVPADVHADDVIEAAMEDVERTEAKQQLYAEQEGDATTDATAPATTIEAIESTESVDPKVAKAAAAAAKKVEREAERAKKKAEREAAKASEPVKAPRVTSITHKPGALLCAKLGTDFRDYLTFDVRDGSLDDDALHAKQDAFVDRMNDPSAIADKVREKATMFLTWVKGGAKEDLNEVLKRAITVLHTTGELTSGDKGNLQLNLLSKPYSMGTARSQANQCFMLFPELGICLKEKGRMVPNPHSALLPLIKSKLGL